LILQGWRIASPEYSKNHDQMLSGEGAFLHGGRWNSKGSRVVYLGTSLAQASMELLVHLGRADILKLFSVSILSFDEQLIEHIDINDLPEDWKEPSMAPDVQAVGDKWVETASSVILQVPSAAVDGEYNFLLNPKHPDMSKITQGAITPYQFDSRLVK
jgi:RES domain-containing protein